MTRGGAYGIRASQAQLHVTVERTNGDSAQLEVLLDGGKAFVREASLQGLPAGPWVRATKRHIYTDLACWPAHQRDLPERALMLLLNADAVRFDPESEQSIIIATVPARLVAGVFPDPVVARLLDRAGSDPVTVRVGQFQGQLTTLELLGESVRLALDRATVRLAPDTAGGLDEARYFAWFDDFRVQTRVQLPRAASVLAPGQSPLPESRPACASASV